MPMKGLQCFGFAQHKLHDDAMENHGWYHKCSKLSIIHYQIIH